MPQIEERIDKLEELTGQTQLMLQGLAMELRRDTRDLKNEMKDFKTHTQSTLDKLSAKVDQTTSNIDKMAQESEKLSAKVDQTTSNINKMSQEMEKDRKSLRRELYDLSKKLGTIVEDIVAPNIEFIAEKYFNLKDWIDFDTSKKRRKPADKSKQKEFDIILVYDDKIILNETKATPRTSYVKEFIEFIESKEFYEYFPEHKGKEIIPVFASFHIDKDTLKYLTRNKIYAMGMKEDTIDLLNQELLQ